MKRWWCLLLIGWLGCELDVAAQVTRGTIAFVDVEQVLTNFFKARLANDQLQEMVDSINRERATLLLQFDKLQAEFNELRTRILEEEMETSARDNLRKRMDAKLVDIRKLEERITVFNETQSRRWEEQNRRIRSNLMTEIHEKMKNLMKSRGYLAVVDSSQVNEKGDPAVLYLDPKGNITQDVIDEVNK